MRLKVCGMTKIDQLKELEELGIDFAGLIFYKPSPRYALNGGLSPSKIKTERVKINKIGVFVNESTDNILKIVDDWKLDMVQLHGDESPRFCEQISNHITTIKAFRIGNENNTAYKVFPYTEETDLFLFDTLGKNFGGTGEQFDWQQISSSKIQKPYFLSGGIGPNDVGKIKEFCKNEKYLFALDVNSKFETSPGLKDMNLVKKFTEEIKKIN
jgi:phosphoribosylanthranilate isomerase